MYLFQVFSILGALVLFGVVIDFIRRGLLKEKYSVLWLAAAVFVIVLSIKKEILDYVAGMFGVAYPPSLLFLVAFLFVLLILLHFSVVISIFHEKNKVLSQEIVLLKDELRRMRAGDEGAAPAPAPAKAKAKRPAAGKTAPGKSAAKKPRGRGPKGKK
jgi:hypothetical protein